MADECWFKESCSCLTISEIVLVMESCHLLCLRGNWCYGKFSERRKLPFYRWLARFELSSCHFDREEMSSLGSTWCKKNQWKTVTNPSDHKWSCNSQKPLPMRTTYGKRSTWKCLESLVIPHQLGGRAGFFFYLIIVLIFFFEGGESGGG